ncbi:4Fe-4S dicluster domain-containing protein [Candidatus Solincola tengchongensis]|uniref:4Fe-4S dicluster domain-containing protein n=1 Tax=Candidatus Solincola tengchongensis TaxID=2900693 RepID=UPI00257CD81E|nr:4Fe-4S dicluster domain-containing protein [Candidatus Solincola tengchongensis]
MIKATGSGLEREIEARCGERVRLCFQCGKCSTGCLFTPAMDLLPHQAMKLVQLGEEERLLSSRTIWICASCVTCTARCPNDIDVAGVIDALRQMALEKGVRPAERNVPLFHFCFLGNIRATGRISEPVLMGAYKALSGDLFSDIGLAVEMLRKGKIKLVPSLVRGRREIRRIFSESGGKGAVGKG